MQPAANPEDIRAILSRFHTWAEKNPVHGDGDGNGLGNGAGNGHAAAAGTEELREISYEEAIRKHRDRGAAKTPKRTAAASAPTTPVARRPARVKAEPEPRREVLQGLPAEPAQELSVAPPMLKPPAAETQPKPVSAPVHAECAPEDPNPLATAFEQITAAIERNAKISLPEHAPAVKTAKTEKLAKSEAPAAAAGKIAAGTSKTPTAKNRVAAEASSPVAAINRVVAETSPATAQTTATAAAKTVTSPRTPRVQRKAGARPARATIAAMAKMPLTREAITAALAAKPQSRPVTKVRSALINPPIVARIKASARIATPRKIAAPAVAQQRKAKQPPFHQVLAYSVQQPKRPVAKKKQAEPDRNRRITTRFSTAEERRIAKHAALAGLTVSAYLRKCALSVVASTQSARAPTPASAPAKRRRTRAVAQAQSYQDYQYVEPTSLLGSWLALLRNRFLPPPVRYSGQA